MKLNFGFVAIDSNIDASRPIASCIAVITTLFTSMRFWQEILEGHLSTTVLMIYFKRMVKLVVQQRFFKGNESFDVGVLGLRKTIG
jgi:hypothetical protein